MVYVPEKELCLIRTYPLPKGGLPVKSIEAAKVSRKRTTKHDGAEWLRLNTVEGVSHSKIAKMYKVSIGTVAGTIFQYKRKLAMAVKVDCAG